MEKFENTQEFVKDVLNRMREVYAYIHRNGEAVIRRNSNLYSGNQAVKSGIASLDLYQENLTS